MSLSVLHYIYVSYRLCHAGRSKVFASSEPAGKDSKTETQ